MQQLSSIKNLVLDMDGVLWRGETPLPGLNDFFATLDELGINCALATNNATKVARQYVEKLARFGLTVRAEQIITSAEATARHLRQHYPAGTPVYVVGESGLHEAMAAQDFSLLASDSFVSPADRVELVVVGFNREVCYKQLASAAYLINHGARFIGTNPDLTFPSEIGRLPGAGSLLAFIEAATAVEPTIIGKPNEGIFLEALRRLDGSQENTAMVGDRLNTDILGAGRTGLGTILLLTGISSREDTAQAELQPDWIFNGLPELRAALQESR